MKHELKTWPEYFEAVYNGEKSFEVRKADRDFKVGDRLLLREWSPFRESFTGRKIDVEVKYIMSNPEFVKEGYVIMGIG